MAVTLQPEPRPPRRPQIGDFDAFCPHCNKPRSMCTCAKRKRKISEQLEEAILKWLQRNDKK